MWLGQLQQSDDPEVNVNKIFDWLITDHLIRAANYVDPMGSETTSKEKIHKVCKGDKSL